MWIHGEQFDTTYRIHVDTYTRCLDRKGKIAFLAHISIKEERGRGRGRERGRGRGIGRERERERKRKRKRDKKR